MEVNNSKGAIKASIIDSLRGAGEIGLHIDDIFDLVKSHAGFDIRTIADINPCLKDLSLEGLIIEILGTGLWRVSNLPNQTPAPTPIVKNAIATHPPTVTVPPIIQLPGNGKFTSYKNSLQEYCQKLAIPVPRYRANCTSAGRVGTVEFWHNLVHAKEPSTIVKDADQRAAFQALKDLGYLSADTTYEFSSSKKNSIKRKESETDEAPPSKVQCKGFNDMFGYQFTTFKSDLNIFAQKSKLPTPEYHTVQAGDGFFSTVTFNRREYKSKEICKKKKDAEQSAAQVALTILTGLEKDISNEKPDITASDVDKMIVNVRHQTGPSNNAGVPSLKNRLQEYCQRMKKNLPFYQTMTNADNTYTTMVTVEDKSFTGQACDTKKAAERTAAEQALKAFGLMVEKNDDK